MKNKIFLHSMEIFFPIICVKNSILFCSLDISNDLGFLKTDGLFGVQGHTYNIFCSFRPTISKKVISSILGPLQRLIVLDQKAGVLNRMLFTQFGKKSTNLSIGSIFCLILIPN